MVRADPPIQVRNIPGCCQITEAPHLMPHPPHGSHRLTARASSATDATAPRAEERAGGLPGPSGPGPHTRPHTGSDGSDAAGAGLGDVGERCRGVEEAAEPVCLVRDLALVGGAQLAERLDGDLDTAAGALVRPD